MPLSMPYISIGHNKNLIITLWNYFKNSRRKSAITNQFLTFKRPILSSRE